MKKRTPVFFCAALFAATAGACGVCVEDKMALTYDHTVAQQTYARGHLLLFCELHGQLGAANLDAIKNNIARVRGINAQTIRISSQPLTLSFALDPALQSRESALAALQQVLPDGVQAVLLGVLTGQR